MKANNKDLIKAVKEIPSDGWYKRDSEQVFREIAAELTERGFTLIETVEILSKARFAIADEYGD